MYNKIIKRNNQIVAFDLNKITNAIYKAGKETKELNKRQAEKLAEQVIKRAELEIKSDIPKVEEIQDIVENVFLDSKFKKTAKAYILYRDQHKQLREITKSIHNGLIEQYLHKKDWQVKENSNMAYSLQGLNNYIASEVSKSYWLNKIYSGKIREAHIEGDFHIHDMNLLSVYCVGWDLMDLLMQGFTGVEGKIESKPAKHFRSALGQIVNFFYTLQGEAAGAQAFSNFDTLLAPFIYYDKLSYAEVKQAMQEFVFNVNVPTRVGFQTPFTNITLDLTVPAYYSKQSVIVGGKPQDKVYGYFQEELNILNKAFLEVMSEGDARGRVFTFPIPTYNITKDFDWNNPVIANLWTATGRYGLPYFSNFINSDMNPEDARSMCCRLRIDNKQLERRGGGLFGANPLTGSVGVVTINLPRIGLESKNKKDFIKRLEDLIQKAKDSLEIKRKLLENLTETGLYHNTSFYLRKIKDEYGSYWKNHFSTIGLIGMNEAIANLYQEENVTTKKGQKFALEIMDYMKKRITEFQIETGNLYNLEATPAEGTTYRLALLDQKKYPKAIFANGVGMEVKSPFYTNSSHLPVNYTEDIFEALDLQDELQTKYTGGTVLHFFLGEQITDASSIKNLVKKICENYKLPYFTLAPTFSVCPEHGYIDGEVEECSVCHNRCEIYSRTVGYLRPVSQWNDGKQAEFGIRKMYKNI